MNAIYTPIRFSKLCRVSSLVLLLLLPMLAQAGSDGHPDKDKSLDLGDPIDARQRSYYFSLPLLDLGGIIPVNIALSYQSHSNFPSGFQLTIPEIWRTNVYQAYVWKYNDGRGELFFQNNPPLGGGAWENGPYAAHTYGLQEQANPGGWFYLMDPGTRRVFMFEKDGQADDISSDMQTARLRYVLDRNNNTLSYNYSCWSCFPNTTTINDGLGRQLTLSVDENNDLAQISDGTRSFELSYNSSHQLLSLTDPLDQTTSFEYSTSSGANLTKLTKPLGNTPYSQIYSDSQGHVASQSDAYDNTTSIEFQEVPGGATSKVIENRPDDAQVVYEHNNLGGSPSTWQDPEGNQAQFTVDSKDRLLSVTDRLADSTQITYHEASGFPASFTNANGDTTSYTYSSQDQTFTNPDNGYAVTFTFYLRTRSDFPDGTHETYSYDEKGNMVSFTDRNSGVWTFTYNSMGLTLKTTNPSGGVTTKTYNADGTLATSTDSDTGITVYSYDSLKRLSGIDPPGEGSISLTFDDLDQIVAVSDENGNSSSYIYDKNGNISSVTDPGGNTIQYVYDLLDRAIQTTSSSGGTTQKSYNFRNRVTSNTDANGIVTSFTYDNRNRLTGSTQNNKTRSYTSDDEGVLTSSTSPAGKILKQQTDKIGNIKAIIQPGGQTTRINLNSMNLISSTTSPTNKVTQFNYDNNGNLSGITLPDGSSAGLSYNALGKLTGISDLNGQTWAFNHTAMGRPATTTDPLNRSSTYSLDNRGRVSTINYPDTSIETRSYDNTGNIIHRQFSDGTVLNYTFDALDNLLTTNELVLTRDSEGRITSSTSNAKSFGASYDPGGRLSTATYGSSLTVTYTYNADNLLSRVSDNLGNQVDFTYDDDQNLTGLNRSNGVNASFTWDDNAWLDRLTDGSIIDLDYTFNDDGKITDITGTLPLSPADLQTPGTESFTVDAASQLSSSGYQYDARGRASSIPGHSLVWDAAERLTELDNISFSYNGLNEIIARTENGNTRRFYHNHALGMSPIVSEEQDGTVIRNYIYTPSGHLLYSVDPSDNTVRFYHRNQVASTLALTDGNGNVTDSYAYTPYGSLLAHTGSSDQPFTFGGSYGVRQEQDLYQMGQRYYDPETARFLSPDPLWPELENPLLLNPYQFAGLNPVSQFDPAGTSFFGDLWNGIKNPASTFSGLWAPSGKEAEYRAQLTTVGSGTEGSKAWKKQMQAMVHSIDCHKQDLLLDMVLSFDPQAAFDSSTEYIRMNDLQTGVKNFDGRKGQAKGLAIENTLNQQASALLSNTFSLVTNMITAGGVTTFKALKNELAGMGKDAAKDKLKDWLRDYAGLKLIDCSNRVKPQIPTDTGTNREVGIKTITEDWTIVPSTCH